MGRARAALAAAAVLLETLATRTRPTDRERPLATRRARPGRRGRSPRSRRDRAGRAHRPRTGRAACSRSGACSRPSRPARPASATSASRIDPSWHVGPDFAGQPDQAGRQPPGHVEEVELLDVGRQSSQLARQRGEQRVADGRLGRRSARGTCSRGRTTVSVALEGRRGRRSRRAVEQGQLPEDVARSQASRGSPRRRSPTGSAILTSPDDDDEQRVARVAGVEDDLAATEPSRARPARRPARGRPSSRPAKNGIRGERRRRAGGWRASSRIVARPGGARATVTVVPVSAGRQIAASAARLAS